MVVKDHIQTFYEYIYVSFGSKTSLFVDFSISEINAANVLLRDLMSYYWYFVVKTRV